MHPIDRLRQHRHTLIAAALVAALLVALTPPAHAAPTTAERRKVAEEVAQTICRAVPSIPKLPAKVDPKEVCQSVIVENIDPEGTNSGVLTACRAVIPPSAKAASEACAAVINKLLDPARKLFLDKVVPTIQQLACVATSPAAFDCLAEQVNVWLKQSIVSLWDGLIAVLTADTQAIRLFDGWRSEGITSLYGAVGSLSVLLLLGLMIVSLIISLIRIDFRQFGTTLLGVLMWGLFWSGGATIAVLLLKASDQTARWMSGQPDANGETDLTRAGEKFGDWVDYITNATPTLPVTPTYSPGSMTAILICLLLIVAIIIALVGLLMRNVALLLIILLLPLTIAGGAGPKLTREWFAAALRMFIALLLAKPLIVIALRLGAVLVTVPEKGEPQAGLVDALLGVTVILLAGLLPGVIYRFSGGLMNTAAGAAPRAGAGFGGQASQSVQSTADMTRLIMERNAPRSAVAMSSAGTTRAVGAGAAGTGGSALGAAAGPLGIAAIGAALVGGAMESGGRWAAGQAATAGGVMGDVDAPHVPSPPISRMGHPGQRGSQPTSGQSAQAAVAGEPMRINIVQMHPEPPARTPAPGAVPHLVIPGSVVPPEPERRELPRRPLALPSKSETSHD